MSRWKRLYLSNRCLPALGCVRSLRRASSPSLPPRSEMSPRTHMIVAEIMQEAGLPAGVLSVVHVDPKDAPKVTEALIAHEAVRKVK